MQRIASKAFIVFSLIGIGEALYHAWSEKAFSTNIFTVSQSPFSSLFGVPYWVFGVVWFPLILVVGLWTTRMGHFGLNKELLVLITVGNVFTGYLWYLDFVIVNAITFQYIALYVTNYALTAFVVAQNWSSDIMHGYVYGTGTGALIGLLFGPYGVAACGIGGGIFGAVRNYVMPKEEKPPTSYQKSKEILEREKIELQKRLKEIEAKITEVSS